MANDSTSDLQRLIEQGPVAAPTSTRSPLGVPKGFVAPVANPDQFGPGVPLNIPARYFEGDEWTPSSLAPEKIAQLQAALARAGLIGPKDKYRLGVWDDTTRSAYRNALETANASGVDDQTAIAMYANSHTIAPDPSAGRAPLVTRMPNPDDLRATFTSAARSLLGHRADDALIERMIAGYQQASAQEQTAGYDLAGGTGGVVTEAPTPSAFAEQQLRAAAPEDVAAHRGLGVGNLILNAFMSSAGNAPTGGTGG